MQPPWTQIGVVIHYSYKLSYFISGIKWLHISYGLYFSIYGFDAIACDPEP